MEMDNTQIERYLSAMESIASGLHNISDSIESVGSDIGGISKAISASYNGKDGPSAFWGISQSLDTMSEALNIKITDVSNTKTQLNG
jgi:hypothetical protein|tara:strand:- start:160 stop:420 length:261 start_codon:yes stop_codon:yes gene_type:complete